MTAESFDPAKLGDYRARRWLSQQPDPDQVERLRLVEKVDDDLVDALAWLGTRATGDVDAAEGFVGLPTPDARHEMDRGDELQFVRSFVAAVINCTRKLR